MNKRGRTRPNMVIDNEKLKQLWAEGKKLSELSAIFGYSGSALSSRAHKIGCKRRLVDPTTLPIRNIIVAYTEHNMTREAIAHKVGCAPTTVGRILRVHGIKVQRGPRAPDLRTECVRLIRSGMNCSQAGKILGLSAHQVMNRVRPVLGKLPHWPQANCKVEDILRLRECGWSFKEIGDKYGRHHETIRTRVRRYNRRQAEAARGQTV